ncbi:hypothetical protein NEIG_01383 [Nematocida sp. ERTm5]|nr:hypothetical protein NEIG_01383 [Nematocida sp. ERTm5]
MPHIQNKSETAQNNSETYLRYFLYQIGKLFQFVILCNYWQSINILYYDKHKMTTQETDHKEDENSSRIMNNIKKCYKKVKTVTGVVGGHVISIFKGGEGSSLRNVFMCTSVQVKNEQSSGNEDSNTESDQATGLHKTQKDLNNTETSKGSSAFTSIGGDADKDENLCIAKNLNTKNQIESKEEIEHKKTLDYATLLVYNKIKTDKEKQEILSLAKRFITNIIGVIKHTSSMKDISYTSIILLFYLKKHKYTLSTKAAEYEVEFHRKLTEISGDSINLTSEIAQCFISMGLNPTSLINTAALMDCDFKKMYTQLHNETSAMVLRADKGCLTTKRSIVLLYGVLREIQAITNNLLAGLLQGICFKKEENSKMENVLSFPNKEYVKETSHFAQSIHLMSSTAQCNKTDDSAKSSKKVSLVEKKDNCANELKDKSRADSKVELAQSKIETAHPRKPISSETVPDASDKRILSPSELNMNLINELKNSALYKKQKDIYIQANDFSSIPLEKNSVLVTEPPVNHTVMAHIHTQHTNTFNLYKYSHVNSKNTDQC